jgi:hypothetical protein
MHFNLVGAVAIAATAFSTHVLPQADIEELGYCAQFYVNANCQNVGPANPYADGVYYHNDPAQTTEPNAHHYHGGPKSNE